MHINKFLLCLVFVSVGIAYAINNQEIFLQANKEYQEKNYEKALTLYSKIKEKGAATWYNMGNCHYELGHEADALICWKRSQKGASAAIKKDSAYNIDLVMYGEEKLHEPTGFAKLAALLKSVWHTGSLLGLQLLFLLLWAALWIAIRLSKRGKKYKVASFVLAVLIVPLGCNVAFRYVQTRLGMAMVHTDAKLYAGPNDKYHVVGELSAKDQLTVYTKMDNWYKVAHGKQVGWVSAAAVAQL